MVIELFRIGESGPNQVNDSLRTNLVTIEYPVEIGEPQGRLNLDLARSVLVDMPLKNPDGGFDRVVGLYRRPFSIAFQESLTEELPQWAEYPLHQDVRSPPEGPERSRSNHPP